VARAPIAAGQGPPVTTLSYSALGAYARCGYRFYCERVLGLPAAPEPVSEQAPGLGGVRPATERGVIVHALLERLSFRAPVAPSPEAAAAAAAAAGLRAPTPDEAAELAAVVGRFADSPLCERLARATEIRREERFAFELVSPVLVNGVIDVLARESGGGALVVDYKSDRLDGGDPTLLVDGPYATQRLVYALAALRGGAATVEVAYCFLEQPERPVTATYDRSQLDDLDQRLRRLADGVLRREFEVSPAPHRGLCAGCPAEGGLCSWPLESTRRESADRLF
jgi:ATP-dependent exoDNAse (exonuclease V) beta subunit